jgi:AcrR family transcriptional regulator
VELFVCFPHFQARRIGAPVSRYFIPFLSRHQFIHRRSALAFAAAQTESARPRAFDPAVRPLPLQQYELSLTIVYSHSAQGHMTQKPQTSPRKSASQARSRLTVNAILEATARILVKEGYGRASTNKIAAKAGVSIGSLYQYFPSKEALIAAVSERHSHEVLQSVRNALVKVAARPIEEAVRGFVSIAIDAHRINPKLHRVLAEEIPRLGRVARVETINLDAHALIRGYLDAHRDEIDIADLDLAAFICVTVVEALTHAAVLHRPDILTNEKAEKFVDEVTDLVVRYLRRS